MFYVNPSLLNGWSLNIWIHQQLKQQSPNKDLLGLFNKSPKFVKKYENLRNKIKQAAKNMLSEQGFDNRFKDAMSGAGFSDEEQDDIMSRDIGSPFPGTDDDVSNGYKAAQALKDELRYVTYKKLSDEELDTFSKEMMLHFIENTTAQAAAKIWFGKKGL